VPVAPSRRSFPASVLLAIAILAVVSLPSLGEVKEVVITSRRPWLEGKPQGAAGPYEKLEGHIIFAVDPKKKANRRIADLPLAPRNAQGQVAFSADFVLLRPIDPAKARPAALIEVINRGRTLLGSAHFFSSEPHVPFVLTSLDGAKLRDAFLFEQGFTVVWIGWQYDLPEKFLHLNVPTAATAQSIVRESFLLDEKEAATGLHAIPASHCAADAAQPAATLTSKHSFDGPTELVPRTAWSFARPSDFKSAADPIPDPCSILLIGGFRPDYMYEAIYTGTPSPVAGLSLAAFRDLASYLKYGGPPSPLREHPETTRRILGFGYSQSARFLRQFLYQDFNADERGRIAFDALFIASAGDGRGSFNQRYAAPGDQGNSVLDDLRPVDIFPFTDGDERDPVTHAKGGLLDAAHKSKTVPKIFYTFSSSEYWDRYASLIYTTVDGQRQLPLDPSARLYFFPGVAHVAGPLPAARHWPNQPDSYVNDINFTSAGWAFRALLLDLDNWVATKTAPPDSSYPHLGGELVSRDKVDFPKIPGMDFPPYLPQDWRMDYGPDFASKGIITNEPPKLGPLYTTLVPQVNADGNDTGGVALPFVAVPLGTYTGWNYALPRHESFHYLGGLIGSFQPFAKTKSDRQQAGDARSSIEERYTDRSDYLDKVHAATLQLVARKLIRPEDVFAIEKESAATWDAVTPPTLPATNKQ